MIRAFPAFVLGILLGLGKAVLTEIEVFLIACLGILVGFQVNALVGGIAAISFYLIFRMVGHYVTLLAKEIRFLSTVMDRRNSS